MPGNKGPKCRKCGRETYVTTWGTPGRRIPYCGGCSKLPGSCTCQPTSYVGKRRKK